MKLEQQVTSLELSKRLKELGVKQESLFYWHNYSLTAYGWSKWNFNKNDWYITDESYIKEINDSNGYTSSIPKEAEEYSAYTVAELGEMLPSYFASHNRGFKDMGDWLCFDNGENKPDISQRAETEADARAKCLIYLLENNLLK